MSGDEYETGSEDGSSESGSSSSSEHNEQPPAPVPNLYPWGVRPCFRQMLEGGNKKLVLSEPPTNVIDYYKDKVNRSCGCTYDNGTNTFYATSPGSKGARDGQLLALSGNCDVPPFCVADDLAEPSAVCVHEPGKSVAVITTGGVFVYERVLDDKGKTVSYSSRKVSYKKFYRGIAGTAGGGVVTFMTGSLFLLDGSVADGQERVLAKVCYDAVINSELFMFQEARRNAKSNCCFMDIMNNTLAVSDLQKHVISLWNIEESADRNAFHYACAVDVGDSVPAALRGRPSVQPDQVPVGKCVYVSGIRQDREGWVLVADASGRTIQIFDNQLRFVTRVETPGQLPYISGLYIEGNGHVMVCDRKNEMGGLRVYMLEAAEGVAACVKLQQQQLQPMQPQLQPQPVQQQQQGGWPQSSGRYHEDRQYQDRYQDRKYQGRTKDRYQGGQDIKYQDRYQEKPRQQIQYQNGQYQALQVWDSQYANIQYQDGQQSVLQVWDSQYANIQYQYGQQSTLDREWQSIQNQGRQYTVPDRIPLTYSYSYPPY